MSEQTRNRAVRTLLSAIQHPEVEGCVNLHDVLDAFTDHILAEQWTDPPDPTAGEERGDGASMIAAERRRQVEGEGWDARHDHDHQGAELAQAAGCYVEEYLRRHETGEEATPGTYPRYWPFGLAWWKPRGPVRDLVRAGALIAAELDRITSQPEASDG